MSVDYQAGERIKNKFRKRFPTFILEFHRKLRWALIEILIPGDKSVLYIVKESAVTQDYFLFVTYKVYYFHRKFYPLICEIKLIII